jgi:DNA-binding response OmpR family regulator
MPFIVYLMMSNKIDVLLLKISSEYADPVLTRDEIYRKVKGIPYDGIDRAIDTKISHLWRKLGDNVKSAYNIKTIWGGRLYFYF